jgi:3-dehydroquinate dehydratase type I
VTQLCVPIFVDTVEQTQRDMALAGEAGATIIELRFDRLQDPGTAVRLLRNANPSAIATFRPESEGGESQMSDELRFDFLRSQPLESAAYIDIELAHASKVSGAT